MAPFDDDDDDDDDGGLEETVTVGDDELLVEDAAWRVDVDVTIVRCGGVLVGVERLID